METGLEVPGTLVNPRRYWMRRVPLIGSHQGEERAALGSNLRFPNEQPSAGTATPGNAKLTQKARINEKFLNFVLLKICLLGRIN